MLKIKHGLQELGTFAFLFLTVLFDRSGIHYTDKGLYYTTVTSFLCLISFTHTSLNQVSIQSPFMT